MGTAQYMLAQLSEGWKKWHWHADHPAVSLFMPLTFFFFTFYQSNFHIFLTSFLFPWHGAMVHFKKTHFIIFIHWSLLLIYKWFCVLYRWILFIFFFLVCNHMLSCFWYTAFSKDRRGKRIQKYFKKLMYNLSQSSQTAIKKNLVSCFCFFPGKQKILDKVSLVVHIKPADVISLSS